MIISDMLDLLFYLDGIRRTIKSIMIYMIKAHTIP